MSDFKLMFSNCRLYNEEGSTIYEVRLFLLLAGFFRVMFPFVVQFNFGFPGCRVINPTAH
jgi:hypothetical protein